MIKRQERQCRAKGKASYSKPSFILIKSGEITTHSISNEKNVLLIIDEGYALVNEAVARKCHEWMTNFVLQAFGYKG